MIFFTRPEDLSNTRWTITDNDVYRDRRPRSIDSIPIGRCDAPVRESIIIFELTMCVHVRMTNSVCAATSLLSRRSRRQKNETFSGSPVRLYPIRQRENHRRSPFDSDELIISLSLASVALPLAKTNESRRTDPTDSSCCR